MIKTLPIYQLTNLSDNDLENLYQLEQLLFPDDSWDKLALQDLFVQDYNHFFVVKDLEKIVGFCIVQIMFDTAEILRIGVDKNYQGQGIAKQLLNNVVDFLTNLSVEKLLLEVRADNISAIGLYQSFNFLQIHCRKNYYRLQNGLSVDALILQKELLSG